jgi:hypothetical protein
MREILDDALLAVARVLTHTIIGDVSVVEVLAGILCLVGVSGIFINGWDILQERKRAIATNGVKKIIAFGEWRRVITDGVKIGAFICIVLLAGTTPPAPTDTIKVRSAATTLLLLVILGGIAYNQVNSFTTRRAAMEKLDDMYRRLREANC